VIVVPGGFGTRALQHDKAFIQWLQSASPAKLKTSVCTGALLLGSAGFLAGKRATTHPNAFEELKPYCATVVIDQRVVDEGEVVTAQGVTSSIDLGLHLAERMAGREARIRIAKQMDYPYDELARSLSSGGQIPPFRRGDKNCYVRSLKSRDNSPASED
jgi:cyclohexyl-isocyanide hydratase